MIDHSGHGLAPLPCRTEGFDTAEGTSERHAEQPDLPTPETTWHRAGSGTRKRASWISKRLSARAATSGRNVSSPGSSKDRSAFPVRDGSSFERPAIDYRRVLPYAPR